MTLPRVMAPFSSGERINLSSMKIASLEHGRDLDVILGQHRLRRHVQRPAVFVGDCLAPLAGRCVGQVKAEQHRGRAVVEIGFPPGLEQRAAAQRQQGHGRHDAADT